MNENIITFNIPNAITIIIMAAIGAAVLTMIRKAIMGASGPAATQQHVPGA